MAIYRILIPLDGSDFSRQALRHVCRLFNPTDYEITLFRAADEPAGVGAVPPRELVFGSMLLSSFGSELDMERDHHPMYASQAWETAVAALKDDLQADAGILKDAGYQVSLDVRFGDPVEEIARCVEDKDIDFVVMATHGRSALTRFVLGSVAEQTLRSLDIPVMLIRPT